MKATVFDWFWHSM